MKGKGKSEIRNQKLEIRDEERKKGDMAKCPFGESSPREAGLCQARQDVIVILVASDPKP